jgi:diaminohydroxyphosphoribosylaminopyrimidine deaminase/5-amino-6-(5-phosphoribosylamino)uracil reductase
MVGAVVVKEGRVIGQGFHRRAGAPHAEIEALRQAGRYARGGTLYVTMEPCNHFGRTPPCSDAIIRAGIAQVVIGARDPNPITTGLGVATLRQRGIRITRGILTDEAQRLNRPFHKAMTAKLPWVIAKAGQSLDGKIATITGESQWITGPAARRIGHQWRCRVDAIVVGIQTVLQDNPQLSARGGHAPRPGRPVKVIVDSRLRMPPTARCLGARPLAPTIIATTARRPARRGLLERRGAEVLVFPPQQGRVPLRALFRALAKRGIHSVLIEGGGEVLASAFAQRLVDQIVWFIAPTLLGGRNAPSSIGGEGVGRLAQAIRLADMRVRRVGPDLCIEARVVYPKSR